METWVSVKSSGTSDIAGLPLLFFIAAPFPLDFVRVSTEVLHSITFTHVPDGYG